MKKSLFVCAVLLLAPAAAAQTGLGVGVNIVGTDAVTSGESGAVYVDVTVGCLETLFEAGTATVDLAITDAPAYMSSTPTSIEFSGADCLTNAVTELTALGVAIPFSIAAEAIAYSNDPFTVTATHSAPAGLGPSDTAEGNINVAWFGNFTLNPPGDQTFMVTDDVHTFELTIDIDTNGRSMVMFLDRSSPLYGSVGLGDKIFDYPNETSFTQVVEFNATGLDWEESTLSFRPIIHCLGGPSEICTPPIGGDFLTWTFINAGSDGGGGNQTDDDDGEDSPVVPVVAVIGVLIVAAMVAIRRK